jgi:hypothetical protein
LIQTRVFAGPTTTTTTTTTAAATIIIDSGNPLVHAAHATLWSWTKPHASSNRPTFFLVEMPENLGVPKNWDSPFHPGFPSEKNDQ